MPRENNLFRPWQDAAFMRNPWNGILLFDTDGKYLKVKWDSMESYVSNNFQAYAYWWAYLEKALT